MAKLSYIIFLLLTLITANSQAAVSVFSVTRIQLNDFSAFPELEITRKSVEDYLALQVKQQQGQFTLNELHLVADDFSLWLQSKGLTFSYAYLPPQKINNQSVSLTMVVGRLDGVSILGSGTDQQPRFTEPFAPLVGHAIKQQEMEQELLLLSDYPSHHVFGYYSKGRRLGTSRLNLKLSDKPLVDLVLRGDNYGTVQTGEYRALAQLQLNDPFGLEDKLVVGYLYSAQPENSQYGYFSYQAPVGNARHWLSITLSNNQFDIAGGFEALNTNGDARIYQLDWLYKAVRSYQHNRFLTLSMARKENNISSTQSGIFIDRTETSHNATVSWQEQLTSTHWYLQQEFQLNVIGGQVEYIRNFQKESFWKLKAHYHFNKQFAPNSWAASQFRLLAYVQLADEYLPSIEKLPLTGPFAIRSFQPGLISSDRGAYVSAEYQIGVDNAAERWFYVHPYIFAEVAQGQQLTFEHEVFNDISLASLGAGVRMKLTPWATLTGSWATTQKGDFGLYGQKDGQQIYAALAINL